MKKAIILLIFVISILCSCNNNKNYSKNDSDFHEKTQDDQMNIEDNDDTVILKASFKEKEINTEDSIKKVQEDLSSKGTVVSAVNRGGDSIYIMASESEVMDIRIHKINLSNGLSSSDFIKEQRDVNYEKISNSIKTGEYLIIPINLENEFMEEVISWISNDGKIKVYETKGENSSEINIVD